MDFEGYFEAQKRNLTNNLRFEPIANLFPGVHELYNISIQGMPPDKSPLFGQFLLICHKSFLAAASLIGQAQPDDAAPITRRAIEVIRVAAAIKEDSSKFEEWVAFEKRSKRWQDREEGKKPKQSIPSLEVKHPVVIQLVNTWGILSDAAVHFTPEYLDSLSWTKGDSSLYLNYFTGEQRVIEREIVLLVGTHCRILQVLDWCVDGAFSRIGEWGCLMQDVLEKGKPYSAQFEHPRHSEA